MSGVCPKCHAERAIKIYREAQLAAWEYKGDPALAPRPINTLYEVIDIITEIACEKYKPCDDHR